MYKFVLKMAMYIYELYTYYDCNKKISDRLELGKSILYNSI